MKSAITIAVAVLALAACGSSGTGDSSPTTLAKNCTRETLPPYNVSCSESGYGVAESTTTTEPCQPGWRRQPEGACTTQRNGQMVTDCSSIGPGWIVDAKGDGCARDYPDPQHCREHGLDPAPDGMTCESGESGGAGPPGTAVP